MRVVMIGTGTFALPTFRALIDSPHDVAGLFTQPDRTGRGHHHHPHPMKEASLAAGIPVFQPERINAADAVADLRQLDADLFVIAAYGQILSREVLSVPRLFAINVHASLLPKYRGASPIQAAILNGETETGVTIFELSPQVDAGPILACESTPIGPKETSGELEERLAAIGGRLALEVVDRIASDQIERKPQDVSRATRAPKLSREDALVDWSRSGSEIGRQIRAMQPWPKPYTFLHQPGREPLRLIVLDVEPAQSGGIGEAAETQDVSPGTVIFADSSRLIVAAGDGPLEILRLQPAGKRAMSAADFLHGHPVRPGDRLAGDQSQALRPSPL